MDGAEDAELLRAYVERNSEEAFRRLVERHSNMVYAACARSLAAADAEDATQAVFILLANRARSQMQMRTLGGWLYRTARLVAAEVRRGQMRRMHREQRAAIERSGAVCPAPTEADDKLAAQVRPKLDDCLAQLRQKQQDAIVLHFLQGKSIRETAIALECSEDTIKKRIAYGLEKLRALLARNGIVLSVATLVPVLQSEAARTAPPALLNACAAAAVAHGAAAGPPALLAQGVSKTMLMLKIKVAAAVAIVLLGAGFSAHALKQPTAPRVTHGDNDMPPPAPPAPMQPAPAAPAKAVTEDPGWDADPFAGTRAIDVTHGPEHYVINDPAVVRPLLEALKIETIQNNVGMASEPSTTLVFDRGPRGPFRLNVYSQFHCGVERCTLGLSPKFMALLNAECSRQAHAPFKVDEFKPVPVKQRPTLTAESLKSGIKSVVLRYEVAGHGREVPLTEPQDLKEFAQAFTVTAITERKMLDKKLSVWAQFTAELGDGSQVTASFEDETIVRTNIGNLQVKPELKQTIAALLKKFEGMDIDPLRDNPPSAAEKAASARALEIFRGAQKVTFTADEKHRPIDMQMEFAQPMKWINFVVARPHEPATAAPANGLELRLSSSNAEPVTIKFLETTALPARVIGAVPVEISGIGRAWIDEKIPQLFERYLDDHLKDPGFERHTKGVARAMQDFEAFKQQVLCGQADITENGQTLMYAIPRGDMGAVLALLKTSKLTPGLTHDRRELRMLELGLAPGIGFDLHLSFTSDSSAIIAEWGTVEFSAPIVPELIRIIKKRPAKFQMKENAATPPESPPPDASF